MKFNLLVIFKVHGLIINNQNVITTSSDLDVDKSSIEAPIQEKSLQETPLQETPLEKNIIVNAVNNNLNTSAVSPPPPAERPLAEIKEKEEKKVFQDVSSATLAILTHNSSPTVNISDPSDPKRLILQSSVRPSVLKKGAVSLTSDSNRLGFNPFEVGAPDPTWSLEKLNLASLNVFSIVITAILIDSIGMAIGILVQGIAATLQPVAPNPDQFFQGMFGRINSQISFLINNERVSRLADGLQTLSLNLNTHAVAYAAQLGIKNKTKETLKMLANGTLEPTFVTSTQVDVAMKNMHRMLVAPNGWYSPVSVSSTPQSRDAAFVLVTVEAGKRFCLHTHNMNLKDGTPVVTDSQCDLNSLGDKIFGVALNGYGDGGVLVLRTDYGDKCLTFSKGNSKRDIWVNGHEGEVAGWERRLRVFDLNREECAGNSKGSDLVKIEAVDGGWGLFYGSSEERERLCLEKSKAFIVSTKPYKKRFIGSSRLECRNLTFKTKITVAVNSDKSGGVTGHTVTPAFSFGSLGVQVFYFVRFAGFHLAVLKEMYLHGDSRLFARSEFSRKVDEYKSWIDENLARFAEYAGFSGVNATKQIQEVAEFRRALDGANLKFGNITFFV